MSTTAGLDRHTYFLLKNVRRAVAAFDLITAGDRIAVAVSGGKDSLALLHLLCSLRETSPIHFDITALHVQGDATGVTALHEPLRAWLAASGVPYRFLAPALAERDRPPLNCHRCSSLRRQALFWAAAEAGCNTLAFAHHADDVAQTVLLNLLWGGRAVGMEPRRSYFGGTFRLIRPLVYVPESDLRRLAVLLGVPEPPPPCPRAGSSRRETVRAFLRSLGRDYLRQCRANLLAAGLPRDGGWEAEDREEDGAGSAV
jgi:tRNA 2-thiocytidine biosynthesis protein TtcA